MAEGLHGPNREAHVPAICEFYGIPYSGSDPLTLGFLIKQAVTKRGEEYLTWPQRALFDKIGIRRQVLETDPYGNFLLSGYDYGTARNWARLGLLYLKDGVWNGERLLPPGWTRLVSTPAPAWADSAYGGMVWVNARGVWPLPRDAFGFRGAGGQDTYVVPSLDLVVGELEVDHAVDVEALEEELGLAGVAREAVDDEPVVPVVHREPVAHDGLHEVVSHELTGSHDPPHLRPELRVVLHVPPEDVTDADVHEVERLGEQLRLCPLAASLHPHDHVLAHGQGRDSSR